MFNCLYRPVAGFQEAKRRAKERVEAQKQVEAILAAASEDSGNSAAPGAAAEEGAGGADPMDPVKRAKALAKKLKKLDGVKAKKEAGESINAVSCGHFHAWNISLGMTHRGVVAQGENDFIHHT